MSPTAAWIIMFSSIVGMQHHPGAGRGDHKKLSIQECAAITDQMMEEVMKRYGVCTHEQGSH